MICTRCHKRDGTHELGCGEPETGHIPPDKFCTKEAVLRAVPAEQAEPVAWEIQSRDPDGDWKRQNVTFDSEYARLRDGYKTSDPTFGKQEYRALPLSYTQPPEQDARLREALEGAVKAVEEPEFSDAPHSMRATAHWGCEACGQFTKVIWKDNKPIPPGDSLRHEEDCWLVIARNALDRKGQGGKVKGAGGG